MEYRSLQVGFVLLSCLAFFTAGCSSPHKAQTQSGSGPIVLGPMSLQFEAQARRAYHEINELDPDARTLRADAHHAHVLVNGLADKIKTPADREVHDILFTWLAELEMGKHVTSTNPSAWKDWMHAESECRSDAMFYFGGLTEDGKRLAADRIANNICLGTAKELGVVPPASPQPSTPTVTRSAGSRPGPNSNATKPPAVIHYCGRPDRDYVKPAYKGSDVEARTMQYGKVELMFLREKGQANWLFSNAFIVGRDNDIGAEGASYHLPCLKGGFHSLME
jgi:hypothetical protein